MSLTTLLIFIAMYIWGFSLTIWAIFFDKYPTKTSRYASIFALCALIASLLYFLFR